MKNTIKSLWSQIRYAIADVIDLIGLLICIPSKLLYDIGCILMRISVRVKNTIVAEYEVIDVNKDTNA